jgi:hypothetical protein
MLFAHRVLVAFVAALLGITSLAAEPLPSEPDLLAVLRSDAPEADKAITCKRLAIKGSPAAVAELAKLLNNERLASWARIALEAIPGPEADAALRNAAGSLSGLRLVGVINSIGVRRDAAALPMLQAKLADPDAEVAAAARHAIGVIGTSEAAVILTKAMAAPGGSQDATAQAGVVCAERLLDAGKQAEAVALYDAIRKASVSEQRVAEATRGAILARALDGIPLLIETLRSPSLRLSNMALYAARELQDGPQAGAVDLALANEMAKPPGEAAAADRVVKIIDVLADRNADGGASDAVLQAVISSATGRAKPIRVAAIAAVGRIGNTSALSSLLPSGEDADEDIALVTRKAISSLAGSEVDREIVARLPKADATILPTLVRAIGDRRIAAVAELKPLVHHSSVAVRTAAVAALGSVVDLPNLGILIDQVVNPSVAGDVGKKAILEASIRMPDREACAEKLAVAIDTAPAEAKVTLLDVVGEVGGTRALAAVAAAAKSNDPALQDGSTRLLGKWMTPDAAPVLLELSKSFTDGKFQTRAIRGYIRIARQMALPDAERAELCRNAIKAAKDPADQKTVLEILPRYPSQATLAVAKEAATMPGLEAEANAAAAAIEQKLAKPAG